MDQESLPCQASLGLLQDQGGKQPERKGRSVLDKIRFSVPCGSYEEKSEAWKGRATLPGSGQYTR